MKIQPNDPAYPLMPSHTDPVNILHTVNQGLSIRQHFAALAMQGLCVGKITADIKNGECVDIAECALEIADQLIKALNKEEQ